MSFSPPVVRCFLKNDLQRGGLLEPQDAPSYAPGVSTGLEQLSIKSTDVGTVLSNHMYSFLILFQKNYFSFLLLSHTVIFNALRQKASACSFSAHYERNLRVVISRGVIVLDF